ncbi:P-loop NTPase fold protein [Lentisphaera profundi]|uniref:P-loop NTPase fold protein n=1 Tax=Lentisphaera profundi TaxID=1658616 RepID=A0ABY7VP04_9BACT|nr:P-loop NTPase fold protein [Lentisphaera profundi]WDE95407.1 P-loop NTPase fold protein [Lentisphaera profundi]
MEKFDGTLTKEYRNLIVQAFVDADIDLKKFKDTQGRIEGDIDSIVYSYVGSEKFLFSISYHEKYLCVLRSHSLVEIIIQDEFHFVPELVRILKSLKEKIYNDFKDDISSTVEAFLETPQNMSPLILVTGSVQIEDDNIRLLAKRIGRELADSGYNLLVSDYAGVDQTVLKSFAHTCEAKNLQNKILLYLGPKRGLNEYHNFLEQSGRLNVVLYESNNESFEEPLLNADAIVVIEGKKVPYDRYKYCVKKNFNKPFFAFTQTGGSGFNVHQDICNNWSERRKDFKSKVNYFDYSLLSEAFIDHQGPQVLAQYTVSLITQVLFSKVTDFKFRDIHFSKSLREFLNYAYSVSKKCTPALLTPELVFDCLHQRQIDPYGKGIGKAVRAYNAHVVHTVAGLFLTKNSLDIFKENGKQLTFIEEVPIPNNLQLILWQSQLISRVTLNDGKIHQRHFLLALLTYLLSYYTKGSKEYSTIYQLTEKLVHDSSKLESDSEEAWNGLWERVNANVYSPPNNKNSFNRFLNDGLSTDDALGVQPDAQGMARLIMDKGFKGSLAIGVFGPWGSGKSNFFNFMRQEINLISGEVSQSDKEQLFCSEVCHITFNAWHYHDSNLWASILVQIYDNLARFYAIKAKGDKTEEKLKKLAVGEYVDISDEELAESSKFLDSELLSNKSKVVTLNKKINETTLKLEQLASDIEQKEKTLGAAFNFTSISSIAQTTLKNNKTVAAACDELGIEKTLEDLEKAKSELIDSSKYLFSPIKKIPELIKKKQINWFYHAILALVVFYIVTFALKHIVPDTSSIKNTFEPILSFFSTTVALISLWSKKLKDLTLKASEAITLIKSEVDQVRTKETIHFNEEKETLQSEIHELYAEKEKLVQNQERLLLGKQNINPHRHLYQFIEDRLNSDKFRNELGFVSEVRHELERLEKLVSRSKKEDSSEFIDGDKKFKKLDRIILYIDDLDRCDKKIVMEVLQAVHLLLGFDLFIAVVGVDTRWVIDAWNQTYKTTESLSENKVSHDTEALQISPHNYLEKIFQIPYCLPQLNENTLDILTKDIQVASRITSSNESDIESTQDSAEEAEPIDLDDSPISNMIEKIRHEILLDLEDTIKAVEITEDELNYIRSIAWTEITPRVFKRMLNVYRIIRASFTPTQLDQFVMGEFKILWFLLCLQARYPKSYDTIFIDMKNSSHMNVGFSNWLIITEDDSTLLANNQIDLTLDTKLLGRELCEEKCSKDALWLYIDKVCQFSFDTKKQRIIGAVSK